MNSPLIIILIFALITLLLVVFVALKMWQGKQRFSATEVQFFKDQWAAVYEKSQEQPNMAILDADKLLYKALSKKGYEGSMGEKLKEKPFSGDVLNDVWHAHKVRNRIAHEIDAKFSRSEVNRVLRYFEKALKELKAL